MDHPVRVIAEEVKVELIELIQPPPLVVVQLGHVTLESDLRVILVLSSCVFCLDQLIQHCCEVHLLGNVSDVLLGVLESPDDIVLDMAVVAVVVVRPGDMEDL